MDKDKKEIKLPPILNELILFRKNLWEYSSIYLKIIEPFSSTSNDEWNKLSELLTKIEFSLGSIEALINELSGMRNIDLNNTWINALNVAVRENKREALGICIQATNRAIGKLQDDIKKGIRDAQGKLIEKPPKLSKKPAEDTGEMASYLFDKMQFHPRVIEVSKSLFVDGYYKQAILEAYIALNNLVKDKAGSTLDGKALMAEVFSEKAPIIKLNDLLDRNDKDEQEGFKFLYMGAIVGVRNPKAHDNIVQSDPYRTLEYLSLVSLLMKRVDEGKVVKL